MLTKHWLVVLAAPVLFHSCSQKPTEGGAAKTYISVANMDTTIHPGDDFFTYVHGTWIKNTEIPAAEASIGSFLDIYNGTKTNLKVILEEAAAAKATAGTVEQQVGDMYAAGMDSAAVEKLGATPMKPYLDKIAGLKSASEVLALDAALAKDGFSSLVGSYVGVDDKRSSQYLLTYYQTGLGLPERDYYFKDDKSTQAIITAYKTYMKKTFMLLGDDSVTAGKHVNTVYDLEKVLAKSHRDNVSLRNPQLNYNKMAVADAEKRFPNIGFTGLLAANGVQTDSINVGQPDYYAKLSDLVKTMPLATWQTYLRFWISNQAAPYLSNDFVTARFDYVGRALNGQQAMKARWERVYRTVDGSLGDPLSQLYVKKHFTPEAKKRMDELVANLSKAFEKRIENVDWMSDTTKLKSKEKLATIIKKIGYPDTWRDFSKVTIKREAYLENVMACNRANYAYEIAKLGKPVDKTEWGMTASTINAYYNPSINEIVFPAGILQFPMFDLGADDAINYGAIGLVIGHEITHGFDDQGAQYDKDGNLKDWWTKTDEAKFKAKGELVVKQYNAYTILDTLHVNGALTLGENMADLGGLAIAYDAFKMTPQGQGTKKIDGFTPDQRFFLGFAGAWKNKEREESERNQVLTDPHSPAKFRVNGPLSNFTPFYEAFGVKEGNKMFKPVEERIKIW